MRSAPRAELIPAVPLLVVWIRVFPATSARPNWAGELPKSNPGGLTLSLSPMSGRRRPNSEVPGLFSRLNEGQPDNQGRQEAMEVGKLHAAPRRPGCRRIGSWMTRLL